jgi:hypothetical protein
MADHYKAHGNQEHVKSMGREFVKQHGEQHTGALISHFKKHLGEELAEGIIGLEEHLLTEAAKHHTSNVRKQGRMKVVRVRVRNGVVQRQKKLSNMKGYREHDGKVVRMSPEEKRRRKQGARKARSKRRAHRAQAHRHLLQSLRKRRNAGIH